MKKFLATLVVLAMVVGGCAGLKDLQQSACENGPVIKAKIRAALQIAQVGYPLVVMMASKEPSQKALNNIILIDSALDLLGHLAYNLLCPTTIDLGDASIALETAQQAKSVLGIQQ